MTTQVLPATSPVTAVPYHRMASAGRRGWWSPLLTVAVALFIYIVLYVATLMLVSLVGLSNEAWQVDFSTAFSNEGLSVDNPLALTLELSTVALLVPACRLAARFTGRRGQLDSVTGRFRWGLCVRGAGVALVAIGVATAAMIAAQPLHGNGAVQWEVLRVSLLLIPLQAAGEEYVFRGLLPQMVGTWLSSPVWGVLVALPLFVAGHDYNPWGLAGVGAFAAASAYLVWRTGGLEVAIGWHAVNNILVVIAQSTGLLSTSPKITPLTSIIDFLGAVAVVAVVEWMWRHRWSTMPPTTPPTDEAQPIEVAP